MVSNLAVDYILHGEGGTHIQQLAVNGEIARATIGIVAQARDLEAQILVKRVCIGHEQHVSGDGEGTTAHLARSFQRIPILWLILDQHWIVVVFQNGQGDCGFHRGRWSPRAATVVANTDFEGVLASIVGRLRAIMAIGQLAQVGNFSADRQCSPVVVQGAVGGQCGDGVTERAVVRVHAFDLAALAHDGDLSGAIRTQCRQRATQAQVDVLLTFHQGDAARHGGGLVDGLQVNVDGSSGQTPACAVVDSELNDLVGRVGTLGIDLCAIVYVPQICQLFHRKGGAHRQDDCLPAASELQSAMRFVRDGFNLDDDLPGTVVGVVDTQNRMGKAQAASIGNRRSKAGGAAFVNGEDDFTVHANHGVVVLRSDVDDLGVGVRASAVGNGQRDGVGITGLGLALGFVLIPNTFQPGIGVGCIAGKAQAAIVRRQRAVGDAGNLNRDGAAGGDLPVLQDGGGQVVLTHGDFAVVAGVFGTVQGAQFFAHTHRACQGQLACCCGLEACGRSGALLLISCGNGSGVVLSLDGALLRVGVGAGLRVCCGSAFFSVSIFLLGGRLGGGCGLHVVQDVVG